MISTFYNYWDFWKYSPNKVVFDGDTSIIHVVPGVTELTVKTDIFSAWKRWLTGSQHDGIVNAKYEQALRTVGGDPLPGGERFVGVTYFLVNGWRIKPYSGNYRLNVVGNLYTEEGDDVFLDPDSGRVTVTQTVSSLVDTLGVSEVVEAQPLADIQSTVWGALLTDHTDTDNAAEIVLKIKQLAALIPGTL